MWMPGFCQCPVQDSVPLWTGVLCQQRNGAKNPCTTRPCQHGGVCFQKTEARGEKGEGQGGAASGAAGTRFECQCRGPWSGAHCEKRDAKAIEVVEALRGSTLKLNCVTSADPENVLDEQVKTLCDTMKDTAKSLH